MRVLVATGPSGGHIYPAMSFISALKEEVKQAQALLVLPGRGLESGISLDGYQAKYISSARITLSFSFANLLALAKFFKASWESLRIILEFKPDIVVGFGTLDCLPCLFFAWLFRIKTLIHEQNVLPGRANRFLAGFVDRVAISFPKTRDYLSVNQEKIVLTGNPLRQGLRVMDKNSSLEFFGLKKDKFTLLVMGGSQGSQRINLALLGAIYGMPDHTGFQVIHICGGKNFRLMQEKYKGISLEVKLFPFLEQMQYAYSCADLAVCRAGAITLAELDFFSLPALIVPYPFAYAHQYNNAQALKEKGGAVVIDDSRLETAEFSELLASLMCDPQKVGIMRRSYGTRPGVSSATRLTEAVISLI